jgi:hypothetical protein
MVSKRVLFVVVIMACVFGLPVSAQGSTLSFAALTGGAIHVYGMGDAPVPVTLPEGMALNSPVMAWSPDGSTLAFTASPAQPDGGSYLMVASAPDWTATQVADQVQTPFPISFTPEGDILYARRTDQFVQAEGPGGQMVEIMQVTPGAAPTMVGSFEWGVGCGGGSSIPAHWLYWEETGSGPGGSPLALAQTPYGIVHSTNCTGRGTAILDPATGADTVIHAELGWVSVAPDGSQMVGINKQYVQDTNSWTGELMLVNLTNLVTAVTSSLANPDQVVWGTAPDSIDVFYSSMEVARMVPTDPAAQAALGEATGSMQPTTLPVNTVAIHRENIVTGEDVLVYQGEGYAIGKMMPTPDGSAVVFSQIASLEAWVNAVVSGTVDPWSNDPGLNLIPVELYVVNLGDGALSLIGTGLKDTALNAAVYVP